MKLTDLRLADVLFDHTENSFVPKAIQSITHSQFNHVKRVYKINDYTPNGIIIAEAIGSGYKQQTLKQSTGKDDVYTLVCRYHADGIGGAELTEEQIKKIVDWDTYYLSKGINYGYSQIAVLAILKQFQNDSVAGKWLGKTFEEAQKEIEKTFPQFICSESVYRGMNESGVKVNILKDSKHLKHYTDPDVMNRYVIETQDLLNTVIEDWLSPHDLYQSPDIITLDTLDYSWR